MPLHLLRDDACSSPRSRRLDNLPWVEKYRPNTLDDVASHRDIISTSASLPCCTASSASATN